MFTSLQRSANLQINLRLIKTLKTTQVLNALALFKSIKLIEQTNQVAKQSLQPKILAIGNFDGLHLGHCYLINHAKKLAQQLNMQDEDVGVLSFHPHPRQIFNPNYKTLQNLREHLQALSKHVKHVWLLRFKSIQFAYAFEFVLYLKTQGIQALVVGEDFYCGYRRSSNAKDLQKLAKAFGIQVCIVPFLKQNAEKSIEKISSSNIRQLLIEGNLETANQQLGYAFYVCGKPVDGQKLGRQIGFPTLNFLLSKHFCLAYGVYVVHLNYLGQNYQAVANVGKRPTVDAQELIEVHVLSQSAQQLNQLFFSTNAPDFKIWPLNHMYLSIHFLHYVRGQQVFANLESLKTAIDKDVKQAKLFFECV